MSQAKSWGVTDAFRERIEPLIREIFSQAIPSHSDPAVPSEKIKETDVSPAPERRSTERYARDGGHHLGGGNHLVRILDQACTLRG